MDRLKEIGQNVKNFYQNGQILVKKGPKNGPKRFLSKLSLGNYSNRP